MTGSGETGGFGKLLLAERMKTRRGWVRFVAMVMPLPPLVISPIIAMSSRNGAGLSVGDMLRPAVLLWIGFCLPVGVGLLSFMTWDQEWASDGFKHALAQPHGKGAFHLAKGISVLVHACMSQIAFIVTMSIGAGLAWRFADAGIRIGAYGVMVALIAVPIATLPLVAGMNWVAARTRWVGWSIVIGFAGVHATRMMEGASAGFRVLSPLDPISRTLDAIAYGIPIRWGWFSAEVVGWIALLSFLGMIDFRNREMR